MTTRAPRTNDRGFGRRCLAAAACVVLLGAASCGADDDEASGPDEDTEPSETTSSTDASVDTAGPTDSTDTADTTDAPVETAEPTDTTVTADTVEAPVETTEPPETTEPGTGPDAETVATTFDPVSGSDPKFFPTVFVTSDALVADDPSSGGWEAAGGTPDQVTLSGDQFWILFQIDNLDGFGAITSFSVDAAGVGSGLCTEIAPVAPVESGRCVAGPFPLGVGEQSIALEYTATGARQVFGSQFLSPLLAPPEYADAPITYFVLYATSEEIGQERGLLVAGTSTGPTVAVSGEVEGTLTLSCAAPGAGIDLPVVAFGISFFDDGGRFVDGCFDVDVLEQPYDRLAGDSTVSFTGG